jgi:hypothetical protein
MPYTRDQVCIDSEVMELLRGSGRVDLYERLIQRAMRSDDDLHGPALLPGSDLYEAANLEKLAKCGHCCGITIAVVSHEAAQVESIAKSTPAVDEAAEWLGKALTDGPVAAVELLKLAKAAGIAEKTLRRARKTLGVCKVKSGMRGGWQWSLPPKMAKPAEDGQKKRHGV